MIAAVRQDGYSLMYASEALKTDKEVALEAVRQNGKALRYVSKELKSDKEILYVLKDFLNVHKEDFMVEYDLLKSYEREDELNLKIKTINIKTKKLKI